MQFSAAPAQLLRPTPCKSAPAPFHCRLAATRNHAARLAPHGGPRSPAVRAPVRCGASNQQQGGPSGPPPPGERGGGQGGTDSSPGRGRVPSDPISPEPPGQWPSGQGGAGKRGKGRRGSRPPLDREAQAEMTWWVLMNILETQVRPKRRAAASKPTPPPIIEARPPDIPTAPQPATPEAKQPQPQPGSATTPSPNTQQEPAPAATKQPAAPDAESPAERPVGSWALSAAFMAAACRGVAVLLALLWSAALWALGRTAAPTAAGGPTRTAPPPTKQPQQEEKEQQEEQGQQGAAAVAQLRLGAHNVRGHGGLMQALGVWEREGVAVVCVQESFHTQFKMSVLRKGLLERGWVVVAEDSAGSVAAAGVAILMRPDLAAAAGPVDQPPERPPGRITACRLEWGGHRLLLCSLYVPTGKNPKAAEARALVFESLTFLVAHAKAEGLTLVLAGDFNFVEDPQLDSSTGRGSRGEDAEYARGFKAAVAKGLGLSTVLAAGGEAAADLALVDTYRQCNPEGREGTHSWKRATTGWSRLDRIYVTGREVAGCVSAAFISPLHTQSDHSLVVMQLAEKPPPKEPSGAPPSPSTPPSPPPPPPPPSWPPLLPFRWR